jgi:hypothetical protein
MVMFPGHRQVFWRHIVSAVIPWGAQGYQALDDVRARASARDGEGPTECCCRDAVLLDHVAPGRRAPCAGEGASNRWPIPPPGNGVDTPRELHGLPGVRNGPQAPLASAAPDSAQPGPVRHAENLDRLQARHLAS